MPWRLAGPRAFFSPLLVASASRPAENWKAVDGQTLKRIFADAEYGDGVHYAYRFGSDGTFSGTEMAKDVRATLVRAYADVKTVSPEAAEQAVAALERDKRYQQDTY